MTAAEDLLTISEAAERLGTQPAFIQLMANLGTLEAEHDSNEIRIRPQALAKFAAEWGMEPLRLAS